ncbi:hypothetical protein [Pseudomonas extremaustralis]|uniref:hypothetical protein n=1 Tax=Pseudomonas extremaustralis TaxID=359110 RepID=UPI00230771CC|nr:hypothetical protein [Pseudomonas extremaustralis]MDB1108826.1 hypothetical protein [Pseudomonas extremaustralis]
MAMSIVSENLVEDLLYEVCPNADAPDFDHQMKALGSLLQPALDLVVSAYQSAAVTASTERAFRLFVLNLLSAADEEQG